MTSLAYRNRKKRGSKRKEIVNDMFIMFIVMFVSLKCY